MDYETTVGKITDAVKRYRRADGERIQAALDAGAGLVDAKEAVKHGDFTALVERTGIGKRTAQRWMQLSRAGLKSVTVTHLGGIRATLELIDCCLKDMYSPLRGEPWKGDRWMLSSNEYADILDCTDWLPLFGAALNERAGEAT